MADICWLRAITNSFDLARWERYDIRGERVIFHFSSLPERKPGGVLDISSGGEVRAGPSHPDPV